MTWYIFLRIVAYISAAYITFTYRFYSISALMVLNISAAVNSIIQNDWLSFGLQLLYPIVSIMIAIEVRTFIKRHECKSVSSSNK